jgi:hypothetical protein
MSKTIKTPLRNHQRPLRLLNDAWTTSRKLYICLSPFTQTVFPQMVMEDKVVMMRMMRMMRLMGGEMNKLG